MNCRQARELLSAAALEDIEESAARELEEHLAGCADCRADSEGLKRAAAAHRVPAPEALISRALAAGKAELAAARRRRHVLRLLAAAAALAVTALAWRLTRRRPEDPSCGCWRFVAGDPGNSRHAGTPLRGVPDHVLWEHRVRGTAGAYKPLAWKGLIVVGTHPRRRTHRGGGRLLAFDGTSGRVRWQREFPGGDFYKAKGFPDRCIADGRLYLTDGAACLVLGAATGRQLVRIDPPEEAVGWSWLTFSEGRIYGAARDGRTLFCADPQSGERIWARPTGGRVFVPALSGGRLHYATEEGTITSLAAATGRPLWKAKSGPRCRASLHAAGRHLLVLGEDDRISAFSADDGHLLWQRRLEGCFASGAALGERAAYLLGGTTALSLADGRTAWRHSNDAKGICSAPTLSGRRVLAAAGKGLGNLSVFSRAGRLEATLGGAARRSCDGPIVAGGRIYTVGGGALRAVACREKG